MTYTSAEQRLLAELSKKLIQAASPMFREDATQQIADLQQVIRYHEWRYYVKNDPIVSDFEYDTLYKKLQALEAQYPDLTTSESPTQRVSPDLTESFPSAAHLTPMLSLDNSYNADDLNDFDEQIKKLTGLSAETAIEYCVEPKFDGGTIALVYENDQLVRGATRGNGAQGEDITNNCRAMRTIPLTAIFSKLGIQKAELRGEALIRKDVFDKVNELRALENQTLFANPRNAATGAFKVKDSKEVEKRGLEAFIYQLGFAVDKDGNDVRTQFTTHDETIALLGNLGFKTPESNKERKVCKDIAEVIDFCNYWQENREAYGYEIDGMVVKVNDFALQNKCGYTSHHPRWAVAFKFKAKQATTKLLNVEFQVGKVGNVTPVAKLDPVQLAGVMVSSVSLHNEDFIKGKDIRIGDTVLVERAGDVIPYIVKTMEDLRDGSEKVIDFPTHCPTCSTLLTRAEKEAAWRCENEYCDAKVLQKLIFHVSKDAMDIEGLGKSVVERFYDLGILNNIADIYRLDYEKIATMEGFGQRSAENMKSSIDKAKANPIYRFLHSLSIHHFGKKVSKLIAAEITHVLDLQQWQVEDFTNIKDVGPVVAENVIKYFANEKNIAILKETEALGVNFTQTEEDKKPASANEGVFVGKTILFTGSLMQYTRETAEAAAAAQGAIIASGVSAKLNILVVGEKAGSKLAKAQKIGTVQILNEQEFADMMTEAEKTNEV
jgi:DNA ligase (NAD+)